MIKLHSWSTIASASNPYRAPETICLCLKGKAYGHPSFEDGAAIKTSRVVSIVGRKITTYSGSEYILGTIDPLFRKFLKRYRPEWNWRKPITMIG
jgi:hypothetical protein